MNTDELLAAIARDGAAFRSAAVAAGLDAPVPSCPDWKVADLVWHLAEVQQFWATIVTTRASTYEGRAEPPRRDGDELLAMFDTNLAELLQTLAAADPSLAVWTWSTDHTVGFIQRRMAQETAMHRWDAEAAAGTVHGVEAVLASDGIDEFLHHFLVGSPAQAEQIGGSVHIHCADVAGEWTIRPTAAGLDITREHAKGDCALRGPASDLLLALWRRIGLDAIDVVGNADVAARFVAATALG